MYIAERFLDVDQEYIYRLPLIEGYDNQWLMTIEDATKDLGHRIHNSDAMALTAKSFMSRIIGSLTVDEAASIYLYTMWSARPGQTISIQLNRTLRSGTQKQLIPWFSYLKLFVTALNKLPSMKGIIWRYSRGDISNQYQNNCIWSGFSSCTGTQSVLETLLPRTCVNTIFEIECINGKSIRNYSECPGEDEVLLMPGTRLRVVKKEELRNGSKKVYLKEERLPYKRLNVPIGFTSLLDDIDRTNYNIYTNKNHSFNKQEPLKLYTSRATVFLKPVPEYQRHQSHIYANNRNESYQPSILKHHAIVPHRFTEKQNQYSDSSKSWLACIHRDNAKTVIMTPEDLQAKLYDPPTTANVNILNRVKGSIFGMAVGDALGAHVEFRPRQYLEENPVRDFQEGGTWGLKKGQFTDDTSMGLCLASSLICRRDFIPYDQLVRYKWWYRYGYMSSTGQCFDIGSATSQSLHEFEYRQRSFANRYNIPLDQIDFISDLELLKKFDVHCSEKGVAGNGALMRLAPVPLFFHRYPIRAVEFSGVSGVITHGDQKAYDACRYYGALIVAAVRGETKAQLLDRDFYWNHREWFDSEPLTREVMDIARGSYKKPGGYRDGIRGTSCILSSLEAALWAFWNDCNSFEKGVLDAVNLGDDTDTTAAIYGQLAGAYYGYDHIPMKWTEKVYARKFITCMCKWIVYEGESWNTNFFNFSGSCSDFQLSSKLQLNHRIPWSSMSDTCLAYVETPSDRGKENEKYGRSGSSRNTYETNMVARSIFRWKPNTAPRSISFSSSIRGNIGRVFSPDFHARKLFNADHRIGFDHSDAVGFRYNPGAQSYQYYNDLNVKERRPFNNTSSSTSCWQFGHAKELKRYSTSYHGSGITNIW